MRSQFESHSILEQRSLDPEISDELTRLLCNHKSSFISLRFSHSSLLEEPVALERRNEGSLERKLEQERSYGWLQARLIDACLPARGSDLGSSTKPLAEPYTLLSILTSRYSQFSFFFITSSATFLKIISLAGPCLVGFDHILPC